MDRNEVAGYDIMNEPCSNTPTGDFPYNFYENFKPDSQRFNKVIRTVVQKIREVDRRHIIFIEGDSYGHVFREMEEPFDDNVAYSAHDYIVSGFGPGKYPGYFKQLRNDRIEQSGEWNYQRQINHILQSEAWKFTEKKGVPLWVGEFGSQYNTGEEDVVYRLRSMDDQLKALNGLGIHWTTWTYKDCGVMGWVILSPDSEYMRIIQPVQRMKALLGAENFTGWREEAPGKKMVIEFAKYMESLMEKSEIQHDTNVRCISNAVLTGYAAHLLQLEYVNLFKDYSKEDLRQILTSFRFDNCILNERYLEILKRRLAE